MKIETSIPLLEQLLSPWQTTLGADYAAYRNHVYRMLHFCFALHPCSDEQRQKLIIAACFHDLGIWANHTLDYLPPSIALAQQYLRDQQLADWNDEITQMIDQHHKLRPCDGQASPLVEVFRRGDLVDFSLGLIKSGLPASLVREVKARFANAGFHQRLLQLGWQRFSRHPLSPLPFIKW